MIEYFYVDTNERKVELDGKVVGNIKKVAGGWQYFPKGKKIGGEILPTLLSVQKSLESDSDVPETETLVEKYSRLIIKGNEDLSLGQFIFIHDGSHFFVEWYNGKWSDPKSIKILS